MGKCKMCGKGGIFFSVNKYGLCPSCHAAVVLEVQTNVRVIKESLDLVEKSKNLSTRLSRCDIAEQYARKLIKYENLGIPTTDPPPGQIISTIMDLRRDSVIQAARQVMQEAEAKASVAAGLKDAAKHYNSALVKVIEYAQKLDDQPSELLEMQTQLKEKARQATLGALIEEAEKAEFKGHVTKAIDKYTEALYLLTRASNDDGTDKYGREIAEIQERIKKLEASRGKVQPPKEADERAKPRG